MAGTYVTGTPDFGARLRHQRAAAGLTQAELAHRAGLSVRGVSDLERGLRSPRTTTRHRLATGLGCSPAEMGATDAPPVSTVESAIPPPPTPLFGRDDEISRVRDLLTRPEVRLVTLTGPGGVGKTRLALAVAAEMEKTYRDGVCFVPLASIDDPCIVAASIARALGIHPARGRLEAELIASLRPRQTLLVLDNFEHVVAASSSISELLGQAPMLRVLVTSRTALRLQMEQQLAVEPLVLPDMNQACSRDEVAASAAVRLFVSRAKAVVDDFALTETNAPLVATICRRLDGLPLAIELAAAATRLLSPAAILDRLDAHTPLPIPANRDQPARMRTMHDTITWSHELLSPEDQVLFRRLSVFTGGFTVEAAEAIAGDGQAVDWPFDGTIRIPTALALERLASLVDQSLVQRATTTDGTVRLHMLETIREFGQAQLHASGELDTIQTRHAAWCIELAESGMSPLVGSELTARLHRLDAERANLHAAFAWLAGDGDPAQGLRLVWALWGYWRIRGHQPEDRAWLERLLQRARENPIPTRLLADVLYGSAWLAIEQGDDGRALAFAAESLAVARVLADGIAIAQALGPRGTVARLRGEFAAALALHHEAKWHQERGQQLSGVAISLHYLGTIAEDQGDLGAAERRYGEALAIQRNLRHPRHIAVVLSSLGSVALHRGEAETAMARIDEARNLFRQLGEKRGTAQTLDALGTLARRRGDLAAAWPCHQESLVLWQRLHDPGGLVRWLEIAAALLDAVGDRFGSIAALSAATTARKMMRRPRPPILQRDYDAVLAAFRDTLDEQQVNDAWSEGEHLTLETACTRAKKTLDVLIRRIEARDSAKREPFGLTTREADVLHLVAQGCIDREIAANLCISPRTVQSHIASIFRKLDVNTRTEAATVAVRQGIV